MPADRFDGHLLVVGRWLLAGGRFSSANGQRSTANKSADILRRLGGCPMVKVGINGFGRIGRNVLRAALERHLDIEFAAVNDLTDAATLAYLLKYDSVHRTIPNKVEHSNNGILIDGKELRVFSFPDPAEIPWPDLGIEMVIESSGRFTSKDKAS